MNKRLNSHAGVTLIEILIAVSLLSLLSVGVLIAMRIGFNTMETVDNRLVGNRRVSYSRRIIENELNGFIYTQAEWHPRPEIFQRVPFNEWQPQTMRFVTSYSLQDAARGRPQIAVLQVIPGAEGRGVRLIVNETPYTGPAQAGATIAAIDPDATVHYVPTAAGAQSFVLADRLAYCRFSYLEPLYEPPFQRWRADWTHPLQLPRGIRIEMQPLDTTGAGLHVETVTVPVKINLSPGGTYVDQ